MRGGSLAAGSSTMPDTRRSPVVASDLAAGYLDPMAVIAREGGRPGNRRIFDSMSE
jgi:hypothetical protein